MSTQSQTQAVYNIKVQDELSILRTASSILFLYFAFIILGHAAVLTGVARPVMMATAGLTALAAAVVGGSAYRGTTWIAQRAGHFLTVTGLLAALNGVVHLALVPEPVQTTNLMLVVIAAALFLTRGLGVVLVYAVVGLGFVTVASTHPSPNWVHFGFALGSTAVLGLALFIARGRNRDSIARANADEQFARASLETALTNARLSEVRFRTVVDRCPDAIFVMRDGVIRYVNPAAEILLDVREGTIVGTPVTDLRPSADSLLLGDDTERIELLDAAGQVISAATSTTELQVEGDTIQVVFARDMSERLASEKLQSDFLAAVSHELRTPLTSVVGALGLLGTSDLEGRDRMLLDVATRNARRLGDLIEDVLDLRSIETGTTTERQDISLLSVVEAALEPFTDPGGRIHVHTGEDVWVNVDPRALIRVVHHLVDNAVKFGGADQTIDIRVGTVADDACVHVSDRGPGVPRRYRATAFKGFSQGKAGLARPHGGFGVGLTLSRAIVHAHKGRMTLHDRDGGGATVTVCLPRIEPPAG